MREQCSVALLIRVTIAVVIVLYGDRLSWGAPVDTPRLLGAGQDTKNWLLPGRDYTNQRYVALDQITTQNVKSLALRWKFRTGISDTFQIRLAGSMCTIAKLETCSTSLNPSSRRRTFLLHRV